MLRPAAPSARFCSALSLGAAGLIAFGPALPASAIVYRDDLGLRNDPGDRKLPGARTTPGSDVSIALAAQAQFGGVGRVSGPTGAASGTAISPQWILSAAHFLDHNKPASFLLDGVSYAGTAFLKDGNREGTDVALVRLDPGVRLPSDTVFIAPSVVDPVAGELIWKVGLGGYGTRTDANPGPSGLQYDFQARAGTNVIDRVGSTAFGPSIVFGRTTGAGATSYEVTTAPGDSGGPAYVQRGNQWFIAGVTSGPAFIEGDVAAEAEWIRNTTGLTFAPQAAPDAFVWDPGYELPGVQTGSGSWTQDRPTFTANGLQYTWDSDVAAEAVFGTPESRAALVTVDGQITTSRITFAPTETGSGPFQVLDGSGALAVGSGEMVADAQVYARLNAEVTGGGTALVRKMGAADLLFDGNNNAYAGKVVVDEGTLIVTRAESFGVGGFRADTPTDVTAGATVQFKGSGFTTNELFRLSGEGVDGRGSLHVAGGDHTITQSVELRDSTTIRVNGGQSLTLGGDRGALFQPAGVRATVTKAGDGLLVLERNNGAAEMVVADGVLAGGGGVVGGVVVSAGAELRPGDAADGAGTGAFRTNSFTLDAGGLLTIDLDAAAGTGDLLNVRGAANLAGTLALNLLSAPEEGEAYRFLDNDGTDAIRGLFANGPIVSAGFGGTTYDFLLNYAGGNGNDATLTLVAVPEPGTAAALAAAGLALLARRRRTA